MYFLRLGLVHTNPAKLSTKNGAFLKRSSNRRNLRTPTLRYSVDGKHFEKKPFENYDVTNKHVATWVQLDPYYTHAQWCSQHFCRR